MTVGMGVRRSTQRRDMASKYPALLHRSSNLASHLTMVSYGPCLKDHSSLNARALSYFLLVPQGLRSQRTQKGSEHFLLR